MKKISKFLSVVLSFLMIMGIFSVSNPVFAAEIQNNEHLTQTIEQFANRTDANDFAVEIISERDKYTKVFQNVSGTKTAVVSATPIHYETENGWENIDNTLIEFNEITGKVYKNKNNDFTTTIPKELSSNKKVQIEKEGYSLSFELVGTDVFSKNKKIKGNKKSKNKKHQVLENGVETDFLDKTSAISFENVGENTSVEYAVTSTGLKENIILNKKPASEVTYKYIINAKKLNATLNKDNSIVFKNSDEQTIFEIPAPIMYDANNIISEEIDVNLTGKNGKYTLIYKPSYEWLSGDVEYPVVIDPVINSANEDLGIKDAVVCEGEPTTNYGDIEFLYTCKSDSGDYLSYIDLSSYYILKNGAKIKSVLLSLYYAGGLFVDNDTTIAAYTVTSDWSESTVTYNTKPTTINSLIDRRPVSEDDAARYITFDVTKAYTINEDTYGVCIRQRDAVESEVLTMFASSEHPTASQQPYFTIEYYESQGVEEQFDYHAFDVGRAGTAYFNDFTEQIFIERDELGLSGINMPVQIKRYFNSGFGGTNSINYYALSGFASPYGFGWRTNYNQMIEYHDEIDGKEHILYCNGDGQTTYFEKTDTVSEGIRTWKEVPDTFSNTDGYTLYLPSIYDGNVANKLQYATIKDSSGQVYEFNSYGLLTKINSAEENSGNCINISYASDNLRIDKITDGVGREYRFTYTEYEEWLLPLLTSIQAFSPSGSAITVTDDSGTNVPYKMTYTYEFSNYCGTSGLPILASATYPDGETVYYTANENLISLKNIDGYSIEFNYLDTSTVISEKVYSQNDTSPTEGGVLTVTDVNAYEKTFADKSNVVITKQFDMYGRIINATNPDGSIIARVYSEDYKSQGYVSYSLYNTAEQNSTSEETNLVTNGSFSTDVSGWTISNTSKVKRNANYDCVTDNTTPGSLQISGTQSGIRYASQIIDVENGISGDAYRLDYFTQNTSHSHMLLELLYWNTVIVEARNNADEEWETVAYVDANPYNTNWQKYSYAFDIDFEYNEIQITLAYYYQYGTVRFDDVSLVNTHKAMVKQNPDVETDNEDTDTGTDNENTDTSTETDSGYNFENNSNGVKFSITDGKKTMAMKQNVSGNYYGSQTDLNGIYTGYNYNQMNGQLNSISDGSSVTNFYYDAMSRLKKVSNDVSGLSNDNKMETSYGYENDRIKSITHNGFSYNYEYDEWGNPEVVKVGTQSLVSYEYGDKENNNPRYRDRLNCITYGNGDYTEYSYNDDGNISTIKSYSANGTLVAYYVYGYVDGKLQTITNVTDNCTVKYTDNGTEYYNSSNATETPIYSKGFETDENGKRNSVEFLGGLSYTKNANTNKFNSETGKNETFGSFTTPTRPYELYSATDYFGRTENKSFSYILSQESGVNYSIKNNTEYIYRDYEDEEEPGKTFTTSQVTSYKTTFSEIVGSSDSSNSTETVLDGKQYYYEYDGRGNITRISSADCELGALGIATEICSYVYDEVGQLIRENDAIAEMTSVYVYDKGGNLVQRKIYEYSTGELPEDPEDIWDYTYDSTWKDKLIAFEDFQIQTDSIGNPLNYYATGVDGEKTGTLEWNGRQLAAAVVGGTRYEYSYNTEGLRTRTVYRDAQTNEISSIIKYFWNNGQMTGYCITEEDGTVVAVLKNFFDNSGEQIGYEIYLVEDNEYIRFFFEKNLQGDIIGVYNEDGEKVLTYWYDSWGNVSPTYNKENSNILAQSVIAVIFTPITYRGYIYDPNTGLYYLQSRYYNPTYGRFLNADSIMKTGEPLGANIFAYCGNNPVNFVDYDGRDAIDSDTIRNVVYAIVMVVVLDKILKDYNLSHILSYEFVSMNFSNFIAGIYDLNLAFKSESSNDYDTYYYLKISLGNVQSWYYYKDFYDSIYNSDWQVFYSIVSAIAFAFIAKSVWAGITVGVVEIFLSHLISKALNEELIELDNKLRPYGYEWCLFRLEYVTRKNLYNDGTTEFFEMIDSPIYLFAKEGEYEYA